MLNVLLDTNIIIDSSLSRDPWCAESDALLDKSRDGQHMKAFVTPLSLKDTYFVTTKLASEAHARQFLRFVLESCEVLAVDADTCVQALDGAEPDFEGGLIAAAAVQGNVDAIISRDENAFNNLPIPKIDPRLFVQFFMAEHPYPNQTEEHWAVVPIEAAQD